MLSNNDSQFKNIPNYSDLVNNENAYIAGREFYSNIRTKVSNRFSDSEHRITIAPLDFVFSFIRSQSSIYTGTFRRTLELGANAEGFIDIDQINSELGELERLTNLHKKAGLWLFTEGTFLMENTTKLKAQALSPLQYFKSDAQEDASFYFFLSIDDKRTDLYVCSQDYNIQQMYYIDLPMISAVKDWDTTKEPLEQYGADDQEEPIIYEQSIEELGGITKLPFVEVGYKYAGEPEKNPIIDLQENYIAELSWGLYTAESKLIHQVVVGSNMDTEELKKNFKNLGKADRVVKLRVGDTLNIFDTGNITVLKDIFVIFRELINQKALQAGADASAIITQEAKVESGEAKAIKLNYRNDVRATQFFMWKDFENRMWSIVSVVFGTAVDFNGIYFAPLALNETKKDKLEYAIRMRDEGFFNAVDAYAYIFDLTYDDAEEKMKEKGLIMQKIEEE